MVVMSSSVKGLYITWNTSVLTVDLVFKGTLRNVVGDLEISIIHPFPENLEGLFALDPLFDNHDAVTGQHGKDDLPRILRVP